MQEKPKASSAAFLDDIKGGSYSLKKVNVDTEVTKRAQERMKGTKEGLMHEIKTQNSLDVRLLDQVRSANLFNVAEFVIFARDSFIRNIT